MLFTGALTLFLRRRRAFGRLALTLLAAVTLSLATGCFHSSFTVEVTSGGAYQIPLTATDANGLSHTAILKLTIRH